MSHSLTETATYDASVVVPDGGDPRTAASVVEGMQALANRTKYIKDLLSGDLPAGLILDPTDATVPLWKTTKGAGDDANAGNLWKLIGSGPGAGTSISRLYVGEGGAGFLQFCVTVNAAWNPVTLKWVPDDTASYSSRMSLGADTSAGGGGYEYKTPTATPWSDTGWTGGTSITSDGVITSGGGYRFLGQKNWGVPLASFIQLDGASWELSLGTYKGIRALGAGAIAFLIEGKADGDTIDRIRATVNPVNTTGITITAAKNVHNISGELEPVLTPLGTPATTSSTARHTLTVSPDYTVDRGNEELYLVVEGSDADDLVHSVDFREAYVP
jgi:hypothetical protein